MPACVVTTKCADYEVFEPDYCPTLSTCVDTATGAVCKAIDGVRCKTSTGSACSDNICTGNECTFEIEDECAENTQDFGTKMVSDRGDSDLYQQRTYTYTEAKFTLELTGWTHTRLYQPGFLRAIQGSAEVKITQLDVGRKYILSIFQGYVHDEMYNLLAYDHTLTINAATQVSIHPNNWAVETPVWTGEVQADCDGNINLSFLNNVNAKHVQFSGIKIESCVALTAEQATHRCPGYVSTKCADQADYCPSLSTCVDTATGAVCKAMDGVTCKTSTGSACSDNICTGDGCTFEDIDECADNTHNCPATQDGNNVMCVNTVGSFECRQKIITDENCEEDEEGKIIVDHANGWKYRGTSGKHRSHGIINKANENGHCKADCTTGDASYAPYCYPKETGTWDYCKCASTFIYLTSASLF